MKHPPRTIVAAVLGLGSAATLAALFMEGGHLPRIWGPPPEPPVIVSTGSVKEGDNLATILAAKSIPPLKGEGRPPKAGGVGSAFHLRDFPHPARGACHRAGPIGPDPLGAAR